MLVLKKTVKVKSPHHETYRQRDTVMDHINMDNSVEIVCKQTLLSPSNLRFAKFVPKQAQQTITTDIHCVVKAVDASSSQVFATEHQRRLQFLKLLRLVYCSCQSVLLMIILYHSITFHTWTCLFLIKNIILNILQSLKLTVHNGRQCLKN